jgi:hypothetical protein
MDVNLFSNFQLWRETMKHRRPKGEGSITVLPNGHYKMTISIGVDVTGKQRRKSVTAATKTELMRKAAQLHLSAGMAVKETPIPSFKEAVEGFLDEKEDLVSQGTLRSYRKTFRCAWHPLDACRLDKVTADRIDDILDGLKASLKASTLRHYHATKLLMSLVLPLSCRCLKAQPTRLTRYKNRHRNNVDRDSSKCLKELVCFLFSVFNILYCLPTLKQGSFPSLQYKEVVVGCNLPVVTFKYIHILIPLGEEVEVVRRGRTKGTICTHATLRCLNISLEET